FFLSFSVTTSIMKPLIHSPSISTWGNWLFNPSSNFFIAAADSVSAHLICFTLLPSSEKPEYRAIYTWSNCTFCLVASARAHAYAAATNAFSEKSVGTSIEFMAFYFYSNLAKLAMICKCLLINPTRFRNHRFRAHLVVRRPTPRAYFPCNRCPSRQSR